MLALLKRPTAFLPILISAAFLVPLTVGLLRGTLVRQPDEGTVAHLFQILMPVQIVIIGAFAVSWLPKRALAAAEVLCLQLAGLVCVLSIVYFRHL
jgi:hypothetical protein